MPNPDSTPPSKITLEELLRLKRHERPAPEYWARFDRELKARALRSFVQAEPLPWRWMRALINRTTPWVTAGATALLAIGFTLHNQVAQISQVAVETSPSSTVVVAQANPAPVTVAPAIPNNAAGRETDNAPIEGKRPTYVLAALTEAANSENFHVVPATVAFEVKRAGAVQYDAVAYVDASSSTRASGMAY